MANKVAEMMAAAAQALGAMEAKEMQAVSLYECAMLLELLPTTLPDVRLKLASRLRHEATCAWIKNGDPSEVFAALAALWRYSPAYVSGPQLSAAIQRLIKSEIAVGGPYTFGAGDTFCTHVHIAAFLARVAEPLPNVTAFLHKEANRSLPRIYASSYFLYLTTTIHPTVALAAYGRRHWQEVLDAPADMAAVLVAMQGNCSPERYSRALATIHMAQRRDGFWDGPGLVPGTHPKAARLTATALVLAALTRLETRASCDLAKRQAQMIQRAKQKFYSFKEPLRSSGLSVIDTIHKADKNFEITLLPYFFGQSLIKPVAIIDTQYAALSIANIYSWVAYSIYDDILDDESAPERLPVANVAMRLSVQHFRAIWQKHSGFEQYVAKTFAAMDEANAWEADQCRFTVQSPKITIVKLPHYGDRAVLATRSFAHALGPMAILYYCASETNQIAHVETALRHYLIARQLNDDLHDWQKDIQSGQASFVVAAILRDMHVKPGEHDAAPLLSDMRQAFTESTMPKICRRIKQHLRLARREFQNSGLLRTKSSMYQLLDDIEMSVAASLDIHAKSKQFLQDAAKFSEQ